MASMPQHRDFQALLTLRSRGALLTLKRDGRPQISNVGYRYDTDARMFHVSSTENRAKTRNLRRDPRASLYVTTEDLGAYAVAEGVAQLSPVATGPDDPIVSELVDHYRAIRGEHPDWAEFRAAMVVERRLLIRLPVDHLYGYAPSG
jgi:PPOX class probable F420-dependent enzyme